MTPASTNTPNTTPAAVSECDLMSAPQSADTADATAPHDTEADCQSQFPLRIPRQLFPTAHIRYSASFRDLLALGAGYLKWMDSTIRDAEVNRTQSVQAAIDSTVALLSYRPDNVEKIWVRPATD